MVTAKELKSLISFVHKFHIDQDQWSPISIAGKQNYEEMPDESERLLCGSQLQPGDEV